MALTLYMISIIELYIKQSDITYRGGVCFLHKSFVLRLISQLDCEALELIVGHQEVCVMLLFSLDYQNLLHAWKLRLEVGQSSKMSHKYPDKFRI